MKRYFLITMLGFLTFCLQAQDETIFNNARIVGAFGAPIVEFSQIGKDRVVSSGGGGGILINGFFLGAYGISSTDFNYLANTGYYRADLVHGGFWLGFSHLKHKAIHPYGSLKVGWGVTKATDFDFDESVFVLSPDIGIELNIFRWFRIAATAGYRYVDGINSEQSFKADDYRSFTGGLTFRFGWFGHRRYYKD